MKIDDISTKKVAAPRVLVRTAPNSRAGYMAPAQRRVSMGMNPAQRQEAPTPGVAVVQARVLDELKRHGRLHTEQLVDRLAPAIREHSVRAAISMLDWYMHIMASPLGWMLLEDNPDARRRHRRAPRSGEVNSRIANSGGTGVEAKGMVEASANQTERFVQLELFGRAPVRGVGGR